MLSFQRDFIKYLGNLIFLFIDPTSNLLEIVFFVLNWLFDLYLLNICLANLDSFFLRNRLLLYLLYMLRLYLEW